MKEILGSAYNENEVEAKFNLQVLVVQQTLHMEQAPLFELPDDIKPISNSLLQKFRVYHPYLESRGISEATAHIYDIGYEDENKHIIFPIRDVYNRCIGVGRRSILQKEYFYPQNMVKPLYGVYELERPVRFLWVVEGPFNLWSLYEWDKQAVALLGTGTRLQYNQLLQIECDGYVLALDPDNAGRNGTYKLGEFLLYNNKKVFVADLPDGKDVNDLTRDEFENNLSVLDYGLWKNTYKSILSI